MLLWKRYVNNKMAAMRFLHLQQYSHRLNLLYFFLTAFSMPVSPLSSEIHNGNDITKDTKASLKQTTILKCSIPVVC